MWLVQSLDYCIPANISVRHIIANLAPLAPRYLIQHAMTVKMTSRAFQRYMTCLYRADIGISYTVGKLLTSGMPWVLFHYARYLSKGIELLYLDVANIKRCTVLIPIAH